jgi:hypothetical protein|tara:strand:+ start:728 stop:1003 length:276 start_codon:yes stop_codon:yes gene_type:complete
MASSIIAKTATSTGTLNGGRTRLKSFVVKSAGSGSPAAVFRNGSGSGATLLTMTFLASDDTQVSIPDHGIIFSDGCHVTLTAIDSITGFFG